MDNGVSRIVVFLQNRKPLFGLHSGHPCIGIFFDNDPGFGNGTSAPITPGSNIANLNINADVSALPSGIHQLYVRSQDANGHWSITNRSFFYKTENSTSATIPDNLALEYFFDNDPGFGNGTSAPITPGSDIANLNINADVSALPSGIHQLNVRSQDANGQWSITNRSFFYKTENSTSATIPDILALEYFFDNDPGFGNGTSAPITPGSNIANLNINADVSALPSGIHQLYVRSQDANGQWSITNRSFFYKTENSTSATIPDILALEYFFDSDPGFGNGTSAAITPGSNIANLNINADMSALQTGLHHLFIRSQNAHGQWSITNARLIWKEHIKVLLQGFYAGAYSMQPVLSNQGVSMQTDLTDSLIVEIRDVNAPSTQIASSRVIVQTDGTFTCVFDTDLSQTNSNYYIVIKHRNSLETWSGSSIGSGTTTTYDFTTAKFQAYAGNQREVEPGVWAIYTGDVNQDGVVDGLDYNDWENDSNNFAVGYFSTDLNGDGIVDGLDFIFWEENNNNFIGAAIP
ncbi:MAG: hypothetical protein IPN26_11145 [Bacteroidetes bacterium]|nr:hypothetical protein [Bacteroidota bacterium]